MADLLFNIETKPAVASYSAKNKPMNPSVFVAIAAEGQEEVIYLGEIEKILKLHSKNLRMIILNNHYRSLKKSIAKSHPNHRYEILEEWRALYMQQYAISSRDEEWLICDRDNESFTEEQYNKYVDLDNNNTNFHFIVSNPAFQLWLLLHFTQTIPEDKIILKPTCKKRIQYIEKLLRKHISVYKHGKLDWDKFKNNLRDAINNSQQYAGLSVEDLRDTIGSHFYKFLEFVENEIDKPIF